MRKQDAQHLRAARLQNEIAPEFVLETPVCSNNSVC